MVLEGKISEIMETWPLQVKVEAGTTAHWVNVDQNTKTISTTGKPINTGSLRPDQRVRIELYDTTEGLPTASTILILQ